MTERHLYKTEFPFFLLNQFFLPIIFLICFFMFKLSEMFVIGAAILFVLGMINLGYNEYKLYKDKITIIRKNLFFHPTTTLLDIPITRLIEIEFEKGFFDKSVFIASWISLFIGLPRRGKTDNNHIVTITYKDELTTEIHTETFNFDHRLSNLEDIIKKTRLKIK